MSNPKSERDLSYLAGWLCGIYPLGLIGALDLFCRGARRKAFQALLCALMVLTAHILVVAPLGQRSASGDPFILGAWLFLPPVTLYYLRSLDWPAPAPLKRGLWVSAIIILVIIGIFADIATTAYSERETRTRISGAIYDAEKAKESVANYYYQNRHFPDDLEQTGFKTPASKFITSMGITDKGSVKLVMGFAPLAGKSLMLVPSVDGNNKIVWKCMSQGIKDRYLPATCRNAMAAQVQ